MERAVNGSNAAKDRFLQGKEISRNKSADPQPSPRQKKDVENAGDSPGGHPTGSDRERVSSGITSSEYEDSDVSLSSLSLGRSSIDIVDPSRTTTPSLVASHKNNLHRAGSSLRRWLFTRFGCTIYPRDLSKVRPTDFLGLNDPPKHFAMGYTATAEAVGRLVSFHKLKLRKDVDVRLWKNKLEEYMRSFAKINPDTVMEEVMAMDEFNPAPAGASASADDVRKEARRGSGGGSSVGGGSRTRSSSQSSDSEEERVCGEPEGRADRSNARHGAADGNGATVQRAPVASLKRKKSLSFAHLAKAGLEAERKAEY